MSEIYHHSDPECPQCGRHTIVQQGEYRWVCLNCSFTKDLSPPDSSSPPPPVEEPKQELGMVFFLAVIIFLALASAAF